MYYAQRDYQEKMGTGDQSIASAGALLTAIANLLKSFDLNMTPAQAEMILAAAGIDTSKGISLGYVSILKHDLSILETGEGAPNSDESIVDLRYEEPGTGRIISTYAFVKSIEEKTIIDSLDGIEKSWDIYGGPVSYVTFVEYPAIQATSLEVEDEPKTAQETAPEPREQYEVFAHMFGYSGLEEAKNGQSDRPIVEAGQYYIVGAEYTLDDKQLLELSKGQQGPGVWIDTDENIEPVRESETAPEDAEVRVPVRVIPSNPLKWQQTYKQGLGVVEYRARHSMTVHDLAGEQPDREIDTDTIIPVMGKFEKDGVTYVRTAKSVEDGHWYGLAEHDVVKVTDDESIEDALDSLLYADQDQLDSELGIPKRERTIKAVATAEGKMSKILSFGRKK